MKVEFEVIDDSFEGGVSCARCHRCMLVGEPYMSIFEGFASESVPIETIVCPPCALQGDTE